MASKLGLYNGALLIQGERKLGSLSEDRAPRRRLDSVWDDGGVRYCLAQGLWNFAICTVALTNSPSVEPDFGYLYAFDKPVDWVRTARVSDDEGFCNSRLDFVDEGAYLFANTDTLYAKYVSDDVQFGGDLSLWAEGFNSYAQHYFSWKTSKAQTGSAADKEQIGKDMKRELAKARVTDAMDEAAQFIPTGAWMRARRGSRNRGDRGSSSRLIG